MSAIEQLPDGSVLQPRQREPPPLVFTATAARAAKPVAPRASSDRPPLSRAASRRRTSWIRRFFVLVVLAIAIGGVVTAIKDSKITLQHHRSGPRASTLLSPEQLGLSPHHRAGKHHKHVTN